MFLVINATILTFFGWGLLIASIFEPKVSTLLALAVIWFSHVMMNVGIRMHRRDLREKTKNKKL